MRVFPISGPMQADYRTMRHPHHHHHHEQQQQQQQQWDTRSLDSRLHRAYPEEAAAATAAASQEGSYPTGGGGTAGGSLQRGAGSGGGVRRVSGKLKRFVHQVLECTYARKCRMYANVRGAHK